VLGAALATGVGAPAAVADRYEATLTLRPTSGRAHVPEDGTAERPRVSAKGVTGALTWGVRNWLAAGGELAVTSLDKASYTMVTLPIAGNPFSGPMSRERRVAQLRGVAVLRAGVAWVPSLQLGLGLGARYLSDAAMLVPTAQGERWLIPDDHGEQITIDLVGSVRVAFEHRFDRSWAIGVGAGGSAAIGITTPHLRIAEVTAFVSRSWYPHW
jgi:hypothetical protein